jgi:hypothetical protein
MPDTTTTTTKRERPATKAAAKTAAAAPKATQTAESASRDMIGAQQPAMTPLRALRAPFDAECIGKLPKGTCKACRDLARSYRACESHSFIRRCDECGGSHSSATIHLDYVGHADLTQRLLDVDPTWTWEPFTQEQIMALPPVLRDAGLWINLTVLGVTRPGFGDAQGKTGPNAVKEMIGDALRNAGMRFGIALDLWAKGDRSWAKAPDETPESQVADPQAAPVQENMTAEQAALEASSRHTRGDVLDDMTVDAMPKPDQRRWHVHMDTLTEGLIALHPEVLAEVKRTWPADIPTPSTGRMTINQIKATREHMAMLAGRFAAAQEQAAQQQSDPTLPTDGDEPPF